MGDGTEGLGRYHRSARREIRKADLQLVVDILPYVYELTPDRRRLRQIARDIKQNHFTLHSEDSIVEALKKVNDRVGFLAKDGPPYYATHLDEQNDRPTAWYYIRVLEQASARERILNLARRNFKTPLFQPLFEPYMRTSGTASLDDFV